MKFKLSNRSSLFLLIVFLLLPLVKEVSAQQDKVAAFKQSLAENQKKLQQYQWIETTIVSLKGDENLEFKNVALMGQTGKFRRCKSAPPPNTNLNVVLGAGSSRGKRKR